MFRKILCFIGWHKWIKDPSYFLYFREHPETMFHKKVCKHCGIEED